MVVSTQQLTKYSATIYNASPTLLPENIASLITAIALAARLSLRCSSLFIEALLESAKYSTSLTFGLSRQALINALSTAKKLHELTATSTAITTIANGTDSSSTAVTEIDDEKSGFLQVLDKYTNLGIYIVHHTFTLAELFALSGLQFTSNSIKYGLMAAEESVGIIDGIFGSNESSRAIASIITLVHRELMNDPDFPLTKIGKVAILSGLTKAMTAFAVLQNVTHKRTMKHMKITVLWKGLVVEEEENSRALVQYQQNDNTQTRPSSATTLEQQHTDVIHELEEILVNTSTEHGVADENDDQRSISPNNNSTSLISLSSATNSTLNGRSIDLSLDDDGNPYNMYEITTTTNRITTRTTRIRPIDVNGNRQMNAKQVVERTNEEDKESFIAVIDHQVEHQPRDCAMIVPEGTENADSTPKNWDHANKGRPVNNKFRIMLSSVSKKLSRKKVERQTKYGLVKNQSHHEQDMEDTFEGPITTMTSTSTTLQQQQSSTQCVASTHHENSSSISNSSKPLPHAPTLMDLSGDDDIAHDPSSYSEPESKPKRRMSWSGLKMKNLNKKKSVSNLFQKGVDAINNNSSSAGGTVGKKKKPSNKHSHAPPVPTLTTAKQNSNNMPYLQKSNSINSLTSLSSIARTLKTTTYYTTPASSSPPNAPSSATPSTSRSLIRSPSIPAKLHSKPASISSLDQEPNPQNFPRKHIISNIAHFIRYASAAYGESFMRILGIGKIPSVLPNSHHPNHHAFAHHTGVSIQDILLSSYTDNHLLSSVSPSKLHALVHYVTVDHYAEAIVLTCRGTLGLGDVLTDLTCDYREFTLPTDSIAHGEEANGGHQRTYVAHGGMLEAAQILAVQKGKVFEAIKKGLKSYPHYGLVLCGHSLGAGVASLLSVLWSEEKLHFLSRRMMSNQDHDSNVDGSKLPRKFLDSFAAASIKKVSCPFVISELSGLPAGRPIHCYTYGSPCVMSLELSQYCTGLVTSVVHGNDIVSGLSLGLLKDFKNIAVSLHEDSHVTDEILNRVIGRYQQEKGPSPSSSSANHQQQKDEHQQHSEEEEDQWFWALIKTFRADMLSQKLFPPSTVYLIESVPQLVQHTESNTTSHVSTSPNTNTRVESKHKRAHMVKFSRCDDVQARFSEIMFSRTMFMDHSPNMYEKAIQQLNKGYFGQY
ncbi:amidophosphoribosyltransferase [Mucor velutinosus]|uniref:sn-1-specific diacylglycerol lipase n=1 Tax=Mucor velutinosus TaxID=708070 RepID=A0AAN7DSP7_9FUNG|nr:amidophosphoribosyltransferase [Mucor velutinosus]